MKILIDAHNTISAGAAIITANFVHQAIAAGPGDSFVVFLPDIPAFNQFKVALPGHITIHFVRQYPMPVQLAMRLLMQAILLPCALLRHRPDALFVFGNYFLLPWKNKTVFMQTAYIVDDQLLAQAEPLARLQELVVRILFRMTTLSARTIVVQNEQMKTRLAVLYPRQLHKIVSLPTPISNDLASRIRQRSRTFPAGRKVALYVSRFYPHKNHTFIIDLADQFRQEFASRNLGFRVTVDPACGPEARAFLDAIQEKGLDSLITNLGEIGQEQLASHYDSAFVLFFPSRAESFGLPLAEAMSFGLPVVVPDLPYARSICGEAGSYYTEDDVADAARRLIELCDRKDTWEHCSLRSVEQVRALPSLEVWFKKLEYIVRGQKRD